MAELLTRLGAMRAELVETMASALAADENWATWLPMLAQVETAIRAIEAVMSEGR